MDSSAASLPVPVVTRARRGLALRVRLAALGLGRFGAHWRRGPLLRLRVAWRFVAWLFDARLFTRWLVARLLHALRRRLVARITWPAWLCALVAGRRRGGFRGDHARLAGRGSSHLLLADRGGPPGTVGTLDLRHLRQRGTRGPLAVVLLGAGNVADARTRHG